MFRRVSVGSWCHVCVRPSRDSGLRTRDSPKFPRRQENLKPFVFSTDHFRCRRALRRLLLRPPRVLLWPFSQKLWRHPRALQDGEIASLTRGKYFMIILPFIRPHFKRENPNSTKWLVHIYCLAKLMSLSAWKQECMMARSIFIDFIAHFILLAVSDTHWMF